MISSVEKKESLIETKSFEFALDIIALYKELVKENEYVFSKQILRSGTSIGANVQEASAAFSKKDFLYKMSISSKEARETRYWLQLLDKSKLTNIDVSNRLKQIQDIINILTKIVKTTQERLK
ncbi:MAG: four helix bundle protein [Flavobacteriaceae bacterium]|nr:four helix bundle protein [Flavobacteriaceae bacterium]